MVFPKFDWFSLSESSNKLGSSSEVSSSHKSLSLFICLGLAPSNENCFSASINERPWSFAFLIKTISSLSELEDACFLN